MIRLRSLGQCVVETERARIVPDAGVLFAVALYLLMERHRPVCREELEQLLWPITDERKRGHSLRQAVYRLKGVGLLTASENGDRTHIVIVGETEVDALAVSTSRGDVDPEALAELVVGGFLPGYAPAFSDRFTEWLDRRRDIANSAARRVLVAAIAAKRGRHEWGGVETLAKQCLAIDPLNEEATLSLAEAAAMHGSKSYALMVLDRYLKEIGPDAREIRLPATLLKRRISESRPTERPLYVGQTPFVGREEELGSLNRALDAAMIGEGSSHLVWGEPGIGKTRLVMEFAKAAELRGVRVVKTKCQSHDQTRTMSLFVDMVPQLLRIPGALGCAPETMHYLRRLTEHRPVEDGIPEATDPEFRAAAVRRAIADLLDAVSGEEPLLLVADDVQWADEASLAMMAELARWVRTRPMQLLLIARDEFQAAPLSKRILAPLHRFRLRPLTTDLASVLLGSLETESGRAIGQDIRNWCITNSGGNPFYLVELFLGQLKSGTMNPVPASVSTLVTERIAAVSPISCRLLQACAIMGRFATLERVERLLSVPRTDLLSALDEADALGLVESKESSMKISHDLVSQAICEAMPTTVAEVLHRHAAELLESESLNAHSVALLWQSAEHWKRAGSSERWVSALEQASIHASRLGFAREAGNNLRESISVASNAKAKARLAIALLKCISTREYDEVVAIGKFLEQLGHSPLGVHTEQELQYYRALSMVEGRTKEVLDSLLRCVRDNAASPEHRLAAAIVVAKLADNESEPAYAHQAYTLATNIWNASDSRPTMWNLLELVYHTSYGELWKAPAAGKAYVEHARRDGNVPQLLTALRDASVASHHSGDVALAVAQAAEAYHLAMEHNMAPQMGSTAVWIAQVCLDDDAVASGETWLTRARAAFSGNAASEDKFLIQYIEVKIALIRGQLDLARKVVSTLESVCPQFPSSLNACAQAITVLTRLAAGEDCGVSTDADAVVASFSARRKYRGADILCAAAYRIHEARNKHSLAATMVIDYLERDRRDGSPLERELTKIVEELQRCPDTAFVAPTRFKIRNPGHIEVASVF